MRAKFQHVVPLSPLTAIEIHENQQAFDIGVDFSFLRGVGSPSDTPGRAVTAHSFRPSFRVWCIKHRYLRDPVERALAQYKLWKPPNSVLICSVNVAPLWTHGKRL
jgi:integrase